MTLDEALNILEPKLLFPPEFNEAISVVKDAMNQYRAIGTIKGYKRTIEVSKENYSLYLEYKAKVKTYETIGTPEECRQAAEKQIAKKPREYEDKFYGCPVCGNVLLHKWEKYPTKLMNKKNGLPYCLGCDQKLDWSDE